MAGVIDGAVEIKRLADVLSETDAALRLSLGEDIRLEGDSVLGALRAPAAVQQAAQWEVLGDLATALDPDQARGELLDGIVALSGVSPRLEAVASTGEVTLTGTALQVIQAGVRIRGAVSRVLVETVAAVQLGAGGNATASVRALETGPLEVDAGDLTEIVTPRAGLSSCTNAAALVPGRARELDPELRARRAASLQGVGGGTDGAIRAALLEIAEVQQAIVISNRTLATLGSGQTAKSVRSILWPDTGDPVIEGEIAAALAGVAGARAGIELYGTGASAEVTLSSGQAYTVAWDYATAIPVYVKVTLTLASGAPSGIADEVQAAVELYLTAPEIGADVRFLRLAAIVQAVSDKITGAAILIGLSDPPTLSADIPIAEDAIAQLGSVVVV